MVNHLKKIKKYGIFHFKFCFIFFHYNKPCIHIFTPNKKSLKKENIYLSLINSQTSFNLSFISQTSLASIRTFDKITFFEYDDGTKYQGQVKENQKWGFGKIVYPDGSKYEGQFLNDKFHGYGHYFSSKLFYEGYWKNGFSEGDGKEVWSDGSKYEGQFMKGKKHGYGVYTWPDGTIFKGYWKSDVMQSHREYQLITANILKNSLSLSQNKKQIPAQKLKNEKMGDSSFEPIKTQMPLIGCQ